MEDQNCHNKFNGCLFPKQSQINQYYQVNGAAKVTVDVLKTLCGI